MFEEILTFAPKPLRNVRLRYTGIDLGQCNALRRSTSLTTVSTIGGQKIWLAILGIETPYVWLWHTSQRKSLAQPPT